MRKQGQKNTINITAAQLGKLAERNPNALVTVSVGWFKTYNESAAMFGAEKLVADDETEVAAVPQEPKGGSNIQVG